MNDIKYTFKDLIKSLKNTVNIIAYLPRDSKTIVSKVYSEIRCDFRLQVPVIDFL